MVSLDYYNGQSFDEISTGDEPWQWAVRLKGGAIIKNWDERRTAIPEIPEGMGLLLTVYDTDQTQLVFGTVDPVSLEISNEHRVVLTPTQYSITDPVYATEEVFPQRQIEAVVDTVDVYPDHLLAREQDGPENQEDEIVPEDDQEPVGSESATDKDDKAGNS